MNKHEKMDAHPCFELGAKDSCGRIHLPVAPKCNIVCNFCRRDFDCLNESRPGVTSKVLTPGQALDYLDRVLELEPSLTVAGIAGPGDPMANPDQTLATLKGVSQRHPGLLLCLASNGLAVPDHLDELAEIGVSHLTLTINAVDPDIGALIYRWARYGKVHYRGREAAALLWERQQQALKGLIERNIKVKVNTITIPGINDGHVLEISEKLKEFGVTVQNILPLLPVEGTPLGHIKPMPARSVIELRRQAEKYLPQMTHCQRCRADAVGLLEQDLIMSLKNLMTESHPSLEKPHVAVATMEGLLVNQHLGEAASLQIWTRTEDGFTLLEKRDLPEPGGGQERWEKLASLITDCRAVMASAMGNSPRKTLEDKNIRPVVMEGFIEEGLSAIYSGQNISHLQKRSPRNSRCCRGAGDGGC